MRLHLKHLLTCLLLILIAGGFFYSDSKENKSTFELSERAKVHILDGDHRGGGHRYGVSRPCKSEFPKDWDDSEIITHIKSIASNDNINWEKQGNGYYTGEKTIEGIRVRVVLNAQQNDVITAYPVNVPRNLCPANDNLKED